MSGQRPINASIAALTGIVALLSAQPAFACAVCYGEAEGPMIKAASMGVWLLFGLVAALQSSFALFFIYLWRRARKMAVESGD